MNEIKEPTSVSRSADVDELLLRLARECIEEGPGFAQETVVLRKAAEQLGIGDDLRRQQRLLTAWQDLFRSGRLSWGYNVDNPSAPFFHLPIH
jgi:hypothetical protein